MIGSVLVLPESRSCGQWGRAAPARGALGMCVGNSRLGIPVPGNAAVSHRCLSLQSGTPGGPAPGLGTDGRGARAGACEPVTQEPSGPLAG